MALLKNLTISVNELSERWGVDLPNLSYIVLKHNLTVIDPPNDLISRIFFKPEKHKLPVESVLRIIHQSPTCGLLYYCFLRSEIENLHLDPVFLQTCSKLRLDRELYRVVGRGPDRVSDTKKVEIELSQSIRFRRGDTGNQESGRSDSAPVISNTGKESALTEPSPEYTLKSVIEAHEEGIKQHSNVYSLIGKIWFVKFKQTEWGLYPDYEKYKYIAFLLSLPSNGNGDHQSSIDNRDLVLMFNKKLPDDKPMPEDKLEDLNNLDMADNMSGEDIERIKDIGNQLESKLKAAELSNNPEYKMEIQEKFDEFRRIVANTYGMACGISASGKIFIRNRVKASNELERSRQLIKGHVRNARKDFADRMPILSKHLKNCIKLQKFQTSYSPEQPTTWYVSM